MRRLGVGIVGLALGFSLSRIGFGDFGEVQRMFRFEDLRIFLTFAGGVGLLAFILFAMRGRLTHLPARSVHAGVVPGAILFGAGWSLSGACPGSAVVQLGEGQLHALLIIAGIFAGMALHRAGRRRYGWRVETCEH